MVQPLARGCCAGVGPAPCIAAGAQRIPGVQRGPRGCGEPLAPCPAHPAALPLLPQSTSSVGLTPTATRRPRRRRTYSYSRCTRECTPGVGLGLLGDLRAPSGHLCDPKRVWGHQCAPLQWKVDFGRLTPCFASSWAGQGAPSAQATAGGWMVWGDLCPSLGGRWELWGGGTAGAGSARPGPPGQSTQRLLSSPLPIKLN